MADELLQRLIKSERPLLAPTVHDALSARLIQRAGFKVAGLSGFGVIGTRLGLPDVGLASFAEVAQAVRDITTSVDLPLIVDADDGYGDVKNVVRTVRAYEAMGACAIVLEDQMSPKKCGHMSLQRRLVSPTEGAAKIKAAATVRRADGPAIVARTDARSVEGLDAAIERGKRYVDAGADVIFVEAPRSVDELERIGRSFDVPLIVNAPEGGKTPILSVETYGELGFSIILYPTTLILRMIAVMRRTLQNLRQGTFADEGALPSFDDLTTVMGLPEWVEIDERFSPPDHDGGR